MINFDLFCDTFKGSFLDTKHEVTGLRLKKVREFRGKIYLEKFVLYVSMGDDE